jgi:anti-sigma B factor antagonist
VLDLGKVQFVDSSGLGAILSASRQLLETGGDLKICSLTPPVRVLFELVRMHRVFDVLNDREEAVGAFARA